MSHRSGGLRPARRLGDLRLLGARGLKRANGYLSGNYLFFADPQRHAEIGVPIEAVLALLRNESQVRRLVPVDDAAIRSQQDVADTFLEAGVIERPVDVRPLWDRSFAAALSG